MKSKIVYGGQWVKVQNMMNNRFGAFSPCSKCGRLACEPVWYSIKTKEVKCLGCLSKESLSP